MKLDVKDIVYSIDSKLIVDGVSLEVEKGEFVGLVGPNGCGKSTLLKSIYRVYKPDSGAAYIDGRSIADMSSRESALEMSVMQQENNVEFDMMVYDMVNLGRFAHQKMFGGNDKIRERQIVLDAINEVGLKGYEERSFLSLSGGEKQRTLVARALVQQAELIILDEPTNHLDIGYQYQIMNILKRQGLTVSSIHDLNVASCYCDRIILLKKGKVVDVGTPEEVFVPQKIRYLFGIDTKITVNEATGKPNIVFIPDLET